MIKEDILKAITELPKEENKQVLSSMNAINVDELMNAIDRFNKVPSYNDLLKENRELRKKLENSFSYEEYDYQVNRNIENLLKDNEKELNFYQLLVNTFNQVCEERKNLEQALDETEKYIENHKRESEPHIYGLTIPKFVFYGDIEDIL